jgi:hypothetical protein
MSMEGPTSVQDPKLTLLWTAGALALAMVIAFFVT